MTNVYRRIYAALVRLHPVAFRNQFGREMRLDFEDALHSCSLGALGRDVLCSLGRQWSARILSRDPDPVVASRPSLLAGDYVMVRDKPFTPLELVRGLAGSAALFALFLHAPGGAQTAVAHLPIVYASSSTPATRGDAGPASPLPTDETATHFIPAAFAQSQPQPELVLFHPSGPPLSYEVATIKPVSSDDAAEVVRLSPGATLSPLSIRRYIMDAYGATYAQQVAGGPDWLNKDAFLIHGKVPDDLEAAMQKMTYQERTEQNRRMQQSLLASRFHLVAHFETRVLPVYELVPAKGGLKIAEVPAPPERKPGDPPMPLAPGNPLPPGTSRTMFNSKGLRVLNARAIKMELLARILGPDAGDRPIVNHTGFTGFFDITDLTWAPLGDAAADSAPDAPSLTVATERTLGIRIVPTRAPIEVLVIDHIDKPSEN